MALKHLLLLSYLFLFVRFCKSVSTKSSSFFAQISAWRAAKSPAASRQLNLHHQRGAQHRRQGLRGTVPVDEVRYQLTRYGTSWRGTVPVDEIRYQLTRYGTSWRGTVQVDEARYQLTRYHTVPVVGQPNLLPSQCLYANILSTRIRSSHVVIAIVCHCQSRNSSGFSPSIKKILHYYL